MGRHLNVRDRKKVLTDPRMNKSKNVSSTQWYDKELLVVPSGPAGLHHAATTQLISTSHDDIHNTTGAEGGCRFNDTGASGGGTDVTSDGSQLDDTDGGGAHAPGGVDLTRTRAARDLYIAKISKLGDQIRVEKDLRDESLNEYLQLTQGASADRPLPNQRIRQIFEKKNQKCTAQIDALSRKQDAYRKRLRDVELYGVGPRQAKEVFKDVGHGIKTMVSKPKEFAHLIRNKFGSADDVSVAATPDALADDSHSLYEAPMTRHRRKGSGTLPADFKYHSTEQITAALSDSPASNVIGGGAFHHAPPRSNGVARSISVAASGAGGRGGEDAEWGVLLKQMEECHDSQRVLMDDISLLQSRLEVSEAQFREALEEEHVRSERLEEQINDLTELHQNEVTNIKQELTSLEEKLEYQLEERTRDMQELLESCQTKVTKMELQQQQQQLISMESFDNSTVRTLLTKLINVFLALLAVVLVLISTAVNLLGPFLNTRLRCIVTAIFAVIGGSVWHYRADIADTLRRLVTK